MSGDAKIGRMREAVAAMIEGRLAEARRIMASEQYPGGEGEIATLGSELTALLQLFDRKCAEMNRLLRVTEEINSGLELTEILDHIYTSFQDLIPYHRIGLAFLKHDGTTLHSQWARSEAPEIKIGQGYAAVMAGSSLQAIIENGRPRILNNLEDYLKEHPQSDSTRLIVAEGMLSSLTCPLIAMGKPIGFLFFSSMHADTYKDIHVELFKEIAGQVAATIEKARLREELIDLNRIKNKLLGVVAHDLRNPIVVIKGFLSLFLSGAIGELTPEQKGPMEIMLRNADMMRVLVNDLVDIEAIESGQLELEKREIDLHEFLKQCFDDNRLFAKAKSIEMQFEIDGTLPNLQIDPHRMAQVMNNLLSNALKYSSEHTTVTLGARCQNGNVEFYVNDQGQGIPAEDLSKIFEDFGKASSRPTAGERSTGLGLAIVKRIVTAHNGSVWVDSEPGRGSTFFFKLPVVDLG